MVCVGELLWGSVEAGGGVLEGLSSRLMPHSTPSSTTTTALAALLVLNAPLLLLVSSVVVMTVVPLVLLLLTLLVLPTLAAIAAGVVILRHMQAAGAAEGGGGSEGGGKVGAVGLLAPMLRLGTTVASSDHQHVLTIALPSLRSVAAAVTALSATLNLQQRLDALVQRLHPEMSLRLSVELGIGNKAEPALPMSLMGVQSSLLQSALYQETAAPVAASPSADGAACPQLMMSLPWEPAPLPELAMGASSLGGGASSWASPRGRSRPMPVTSRRVSIADDTINRWLEMAEAAGEEEEEEESVATVSAWRATQAGLGLSTSMPDLRSALQGNQTGAQAEDEEGHAMEEHSVSGSSVSARESSQYSRRARETHVRRKSSAATHRGPDPGMLLRQAVGMRGCQQWRVKKLLQAGVPPDSLNRIGATALHVAAYRGKGLEALKLVEYGADINVADHYGMTPLHLAVWYNQLSVFSVLLHNGVDVTCQCTVAGEAGGGGVNLTPLHLALLRQNKLMVHMLLLHTNTAGGDGKLARSGSSPAMGVVNGLEHGSPLAHAAHVRLVEAALGAFVEALMEDQITVS